MTISGLPGSSPWRTFPIPQAHGRDERGGRVHQDIGSRGAEVDAFRKLEDGSLPPQEQGSE
jgi:hypothetical protein